MQYNTHGAGATSHDATNTEIPCRHSGAHRLGRLGGRAKAAFTVNQKAYYLDPAQLAFVRPGLQVRILSATIDSEGRVQARFRVTDPRGVPLDRLGVLTPGTVSTSFVAAVLPAAQAQYTAYTTRVQTSPITQRSATQAGSDSPAGAYQQVAEGEYTYTFSTRAPQTIDRAATHTIGVYSSRNLSEFNLGTQYDDDVFHFVPDGSPVRNRRDIVRTETCNRCHDQLGEHGGSRRSVELCVLCHSPQTSDPDTGNTVNLPVMVHRIHMGADLPSVQAGTPYRIIGNQQRVFDFSEVRFPADARRCETCHVQSGANAGAQAANYLTKPTRATCGACHDDVNFATGANHVDLPQVSDNQCAACHTPQGELEFDASIRGAHTIPTHSQALPGTTFEILRVDDGAPGRKPTITFSIRERSGKPILPSQMNSLRFVAGGSTYDYPGFFTEDARAATGPEGAYRYTFQQAIPEDARGTYAVGIEGYRNVTLLEGTRKEMTVRDAGINKVFYFAVTDSTAAPRRAVVSQEKCNTCHSFLEVHGSNRNQVEHCVTCHNANQTDTARRPADQQPPESVHFKTLIHKIHTGKELSSDFTVFGFGNVPHNYNKVGFPGDRRNCSACHVNNSEQLPLREGLLPSQAPRDLLNPQEPITAACLSCHTGRPAASHALTNTSRLGEACATCHGPNADFSINRAHAR